MDAQRLKIKEEVLSAKRGPFGGWWEDLLEVDPELLLKVHRHMAAAESGPLPKFFRHLIVVTVDSVVTHLYPRGAGVHARIAMDNGASLRQAVEALEIATVASNRGYGVALPIVIEELSAMGLSEAGNDGTERASRIRQRYAARIGQWPVWMDVALHHCADAVEVFLELGYGRHDDEEGLDPKSRELLFLAANACPALVEEAAIRRHTRHALKLGATAAEILQTVRMANVIGLHPIVEGIPQLRAVAANR